MFYYVAYILLSDMIKYIYIDTYFQYTLETLLERIQNTVFQNKRRLCIPFNQF